MALADYQAYSECQEQVSAAYGNPEKWAAMSIRNTARSGKFSSDRTIRDYCTDIWHIKPVPIRLLSEDEVKAGFLQ
jgi:starch phosphorylase